MVKSGRIKYGSGFEMKSIGNDSKGEKEIGKDDLILKKYSWTGT